MSRIGKAPIEIPGKVEVKVADRTVAVKGPNGELSHEVTIACYKASSSALEKVEKAKGSIITIKELVSKNPKGGRIVILK